MSEFNISIPGGQSKRLKTGSKYCPADIVVTAEGGGGATKDYQITVNSGNDRMFMLYTSDG